MEKGWRLNGHKMFLIMIENFLPCTDTKIVQIFRSANTGRLNLHMKQNSECETEANIQYI